MSDCTDLSIDMSDPKSTGEDKKILEFSEELKNIGFFPRDYDFTNLKKLYYASETLHAHLCKLDLHYYTDSSAVKLVELANAYAKCWPVLRQLE